jgi:5-methyltetrahydrofolate--homocysteine methyltransferase
MGQLLEALTARTILISDGAWGTMLQAKGLTSEDCPETWNVTHADAVGEVAGEYIAAGSDLVLTNTFGGSSIKLAKAGCGDRVDELNRAGAELSLQAADGKAVVAGSVGPTGEFLQPLGTMDADAMQQVFTEQIAPMIEAGLRAICVETMTALEEAASAIRAAKAIDPTVDVICTLTFDRGEQGYRTMMGVDVARACRELPAAGADVLGSNCGNGIEAMVELAGEFRSHTDLPLLFHANAGVPELVGGQTVFRQQPEDFARHAEALVRAGANIVGGCCGTRPDHIAAMKTAIDPLR